MRVVGSLAAAVLTAAMIAAPAAAQQDGNWSLSGVERLDIDGVSGDVILQPASGSELTIELRADVSPARAFRGEVEQDGGTVQLTENWSGGSSSGSVDWVIGIPSGMQPRVAFETASGDLEASDVSARFDFDTASGDVQLRGVTIVADSSFSTASGDLELTDTTVGDDVEMSTASGDVELVGVHAGRDFEFSTASGDVTVERSQGVLEGSSASGNVRVRDTQLDGPSRFSSASGDVEVRLSSVPTHDIEISSASGDVRLEAAQLGSNFTLVMSKRQDRGQIDSPFAYTSERTFVRNGRTYEEKTVQRGSGGPAIRLRTASGSVTVRGD